MYNIIFYVTEGKCHLQPKIVPIIFEKARKKEFNFLFVVRIGANEVRQMDENGGAQKTHSYFSCIDVCI